VLRVTMLATPDGEWVFEDSPEFRAALGDPDPNPDYDAALYAIKNLGFIRLQIFGQAVIEIELHPRNVGLPALLAVQQQLQSARTQLFRVRHFHRDWESEIIFSVEQTISRLSQLCALARPSPSGSDKYIVEPKDCSVLLCSHENPLKLMAQKWRSSFGQFDPSVISFAIKHQLLSRMMIVGVNTRSMDAVFRFIGDGFKWLDTEYQFHAIGEKIENQPDRDYGAWVAEFYKWVATTRQPRYDIVRATIHAAPTQSGSFLTRYERLLLPWKTSSDEILVTLSSRRLAGEPGIKSDVRAHDSSVAKISAKSR
jgi:hypothetical protein